ncbi:hypothetical protein [Fusobacterium sp.]|uniref:hypothetical protein n=1 Tax=Fusobacterium sp. TaxID=68766 RepID=UPI00262C863A|nr:hypothetical protein [Fusobacterium sp.]
MKAKEKRIAIYLMFFIVSFVMIVFVKSFNFSNRTHTNSRYKKESTIFLNNSSSSSNYLGMRISRVKILEKFIECDTLPHFIDVMKEFFELEVVVKITERVERINPFYSILDRDKRRILRI